MDIEYKSFAQKLDLYAYLEEQLRRIAGETADQTAILANASSLLMLLLPEINWAGFYLMRNQKLILGPFQGKPAVAEIPIGEGVCGTAAQTLSIQRVENVHRCCNHIACDLATNSEIVLPILLADGSLYGVLDIDSPILSRFDAEDEAGLSRFAAVISDVVKGL